MPPNFENKFVISIRLILLNDFMKEEGPWIALMH